MFGPAPPRGTACASGRGRGRGGEGGRGHGPPEYVSACRRMRHGPGVFCLGASARSRHVRHPANPVPRVPVVVQERLPQRLRRPETAATGDRRHGQSAGPHQMRRRFGTRHAHRPCRSRTEVRGEQACQVPGAHSRPRRQGGGREVLGQMTGDMTDQVPHQPVLRRRSGQEHADLRLIGGPVQVGDEFAGDGTSQRRPVVVLDQRQRQVECAGDPGRGVDVAVAYVERSDVHGHGGVAVGESFPPPPMGGHPPVVQQPGGGEHIGTGTDRGHPSTAFRPAGAPAPVDARPTPRPHSRCRPPPSGCPGAPRPSPAPAPLPSRSPPSYGRPDGPGSPARWSTAARRRTGWRCPTRRWDRRCRGSAHRRRRRSARDACCPCPDTSTAATPPAGAAGTITEVHVGEDVGRRRSRRAGLRR